jgi:hypothetical protein
MRTGMVASASAPVRGRSPLVFLVREPVGAQPFRLRVGQDTRPDSGGWHREGLCRPAEVQSHLVGDGGSPVAEQGLEERGRQWSVSAWSKRDARCCRVLQGRRALRTERSQLWEYSLEQLLPLSVHIPECRADEHPEGAPGLTHRAFPLVCSPIRELAVPPRQLPPPLREDAAWAASGAIDAGRVLLVLHLVRIVNARARTLRLRRDAAAGAPISGPPASVQIGTRSIGHCPIW